MPGPGKYVADRTERITRVEGLPHAKSVGRSRNYAQRPCPRCGRSCYRHRTGQRTLHDLGDLVAERPRDIHLTYSQHCCCKCHRYFNADALELALPHLALVIGWPSAEAQRTRPQRVPPFIDLRQRYCTFPKNPYLADASVEN